MTEKHSLVEAVDAVSIASPSESVVRVPQRWLRFLRRCLGLPTGRYIIVITVHSDRCDWTVTDAGKVEK